MPISLITKNPFNWVLLFLFLATGFTSDAQAFKKIRSGPNYFKLKNNSGIFHYDRAKQESWLKGAMWKQYKKVPLSKSDYGPGKLTYLKDSETVEILNKETYIEKRTTVTNYYEEGGVGYVTLPGKMPEHTLTMYRVKILTGESAGKEGWIFETNLGPRTKKPGYQPKAKAEDSQSEPKISKLKSPRKGSSYMVRLKSGKVVIGKFFKETDSTLTLMKGAKTFSYAKTDILSVKNLK